MTTALVLASLALATLVSEDLTCITVGLMIQRGELSALPGILACAAGIYIGDLGLYGLGAIGGTMATRWLPAEKMNRLGRWFDRHAPAAILASRFLPGARLPMYVGAGAIGTGFAKFALWSLIAVALWTPIFVLVVALLGEPMRRWLGTSAWSLALAVVLLWLWFRLAVALSTTRGRAKLMASVARLWRWEFWPVWLFYAPIAPWVTLLSLRYGGWTTITAANPGISHGGFVGESKHQILSKLAGTGVVPHTLIGPGPTDRRIAQLHRWLAEQGHSFPLILKPDAGQRGVGVKLVRSIDDAQRYFTMHAPPVLVQLFHPGPHEAGVFYYRFPGERRGHIFSITDKVFPELVGDGRSTLEMLIWRHRRYRMQAAMFLTRHDAVRDRVLPHGERFRLCIAGNHCQGTLFRDGSHLVTPQLEAAIDAIAQRFEGFHFGRFDVRYSDPAAFMAGRDLCVVELNGVTSESTNVYDPRKRLWWAYRTLARQWLLLFRIGAANRRAGVSVSRWSHLYADTLAHYRDRRACPIAD
jgi:membrane protein DedA with SNARE-associated domain